VLKVAISFDYDSPTGYRQSFNLKHLPPDADQEGSEDLLKVLAEHGVKATFGVVGAAALAGDPPEHCQEQIRKIHDAGHEIASHSMTHAFLAAASDRQLTSELVDSKTALETCTGSSVTGFIPPFNCPMHFPRYLAFSVSEVFGLAGRGRGRQSIETMLRSLSSVGYGWARIAFDPKVDQLLRLLRIRRERKLSQPFLLHGVTAIPLHSTGFGIKTRALIRQHVGKDLVLAIYGHPNQARAGGDENARQMDTLFSEFEQERARRAVTFITMKEVDSLTRQRRSISVN
jgi:hypothetical protein